MQGRWEQLMMQDMTPNSPLHAIAWEPWALRHGSSCPLLRPCHFTDIPFSVSHCSALPP